MLKNNRIEHNDSSKIKQRLIKLISACSAAAVLSVFSLSGCTLFADLDKNETPTEPQDQKLSVVATIFPQYDFCRQVAGDCADITMLLGPGEESHTFEPTPQDIIQIQNADVFIYVGGESEAWVEGILDSMDTSEMEIISLMEVVDPVEEELVEGMDGYGEDENNGEETADLAEDVEYDEHVWTSIENAQIISQAIADALCDADPTNELTYRSNCEKYLSDLSALRSKFSLVVNNAKRNTIVFGDRFPIRYFAEEFDLDYYAAFPGCAEDSEPSAGTVAYLIEKVKSEEIPVVFYLELSNGKIADTIAESSNAQTAQFNSCHNITKEDFINGVTYIDLMERNVEALEKALN